MLPKEQKIGSNKLINRLIKNTRGRTLSKQTVIQPNQGLINFKNNSPDQKYLIPRIAKQKLKPIQSQMKPARSRIFTTHLHTQVKHLNSSRNLVDNPNSNGNKVTTLIKNRSKIQSNLDQSILLDRQISKMQVKQKQQDQETNKYLTPNDFMEILKIDRQMSDEFCYMNRKDGPYDWQIVQFQKRNPHEYMVISKRGLTKYFHNDVQFINFQTFLAEQKIYNRLQKIYYFNIYKKYKNFQLWKKLTSMNVFKQRSKQFAEKTLITDTYLKQLLIQVRTLSQKIQKIDTFYTQTISSMNLQDFKLYAEKQRNKTLDTIRSIQETILKILIEKSETSMEVFMKKMRISKQNKKIGDKKVPFLIGDQSGKDMPYTQSATLRTQQLKIRNFLKLTDYLIITSKTTLVINMIEHITNAIRQINELYYEDKKGFGSMSWISVTINYNPQLDMMKFSPDKQLFKQQMQQVVYGTLGQMCQQHFQFLHLKQFDQFWQCNIEAQKTDQYIEIKSVININPEFNNKINKYKLEVRKCFENIQNYSSAFNTSVQFWKYIDQIEKQDLNNKNCDFFKQVMYRCKKQITAIHQLQNQKQIGIICINCAGHKQEIQKKCQNLMLRVNQLIPELILERAKHILEGIKQNYEKIALTPTSIKDYILFLKNYQQVNKYSQRIAPDIIDNSDLLAVTQLYSIKTSQAVKNAIGETNGQMIGLRRRLQQIQKSSAESAQKFKKQIQKLIPTFEDRIKIHGQKLSNLQVLKNTTQITKKISSIKLLTQSLNQILKDKQQLQGFQQQLALQITQFQAVDVYQRYFKQIELLWDEKLEWEEFISKNMQKTLILLDLQKTRKYLQSLRKKLMVMQRQLDPNQAVQTFLVKLQNFKPLYKACQALLSPQLQEKHYQQIKKLIAQNFKSRQLPCGQTAFEELFKSMQNPIYSLKFFQNLQIDTFSSQIVGISVQAAKQAELTQMIIKVESIWKNLSIVTSPYRQGKQTILGNNDELITKIDDNLLTVNNILGSKYVGPIKPRVQIQGKMLRYMQDLIDEWYIYQKNWIYLQPILKSPFAVKNLPRQTSMFNQIDAKWKIIMKQAKDSTNIRRYCDQANSHFTLKILRNNNQTFEIVQKTLQNFLQKKRDIFQRFYFLSNDQLLQILSTVKSYQQIQPHLRKVFENFVKLEFDNSGIPQTMVSLQGEKVVLKNCVFRGQVQQWFKSAQQSMKSTLKSIIRVAYQKYLQGQMPRIQWVHAYPSQVVLVVDCIMWTNITQGYLQDMQENDIQQWYNTNVSQLNELVQQIRRDDIQPLQRKKIVALITQDVHYRDIVESLKQCESINDFKWLQQLRFYNSSDAVLAKQVQSELFYGYQYLGATTRLVITPLTDRCWMTITGALHIKLGANPAGPAGTGKTESCKDLAKSLARYCIVFNCSDQINAQMMQKLFSGLAYTGSWTCLDQFNRIDIEVLSVIAQQVLTIRQALLLGKNNRQLVLGGKLITLNHDLGIFITMNPGYAGRTQLPDNLKTLFRPVAMMVPDYTLIAQIMLFSQGFSSAKQLSKKMTKLYKLSSQQLSQQDHYDFGMRAVKSVLVMAGSLKRAEPDVAQDVILIRAMQDSNIPKFLSFDIPLFNNIIEDLFPGVIIPQRDTTKITNQIKQKCNNLNLIPTQNFIQKNLQLNETLKVRFGVMLVGPPMGSKSSILSTLIDEMPITINPKSVSLAQLYGNFDPVTQNWTDGLAAKLLRSSATTHQYVLFDGPVDAIWVQNLNTVLDDSMMLCLSNGQRIKLSSKMRVLFQVNDLNQASPATVSRCGMVWVSQKVVQSQHFITSFFIKNKIIQDKNKLDYLIKLVKSSFKKGYAYVKKFCREMVKINESAIVHSFCKFLKNFINIIPQQSLQAQTWKKSLQKLCVYAYVWSIGAILSQDSKSRLDKSLSESFSAESLKSPISNFTLSYSSKPEGQWITWNSLLPEFQYPQGSTFSQIFVPTKESFCYSSIVQAFIQQLDPVFLTAPTGTGKTSMISQILRKSANANLMFTFTAQTSPSVAQIQLQSKLQTQRKLGNITLIPPPGRKFIYFIDDINMPAIEEYGAQPPIQMLRLLLGKNGVWDRKQLFFKTVEGTQMIIAGTHGRSELPSRFVRFFNTFYIPDLQEQSLVVIFSELTKGFFKNFKLKQQVMDLIDNKSIVNATLSLYTDIRKSLLPTPQKSHYLFNLRDVSRVIQGITVAKPTSLVNPDILVKLWVHQFQRAFEDRLINQIDRKSIRDQIAKKVTVSMKSTLTPQNLYQQPIIFCNFMRKGVDRKQMVYEQSKDLAKLTKVINEYMQDQTSLNLVLFLDAIKHICRVARCFVFDKGHIVLIGLSGSGKKSTIMLGTVLGQAQLRMIDLRKNYGRNQFRQDLYNIMKKAAFEDQQIGFLFPQNHMLHDSFLEDINNLLSSGEVPCMFTKQNNQQITQAVGYEVFLKRVLANLHVCITLSPIGQQFRSKIRNFPSLVNCCALDWVDKWPQQALTNVALMKLEDKSVVNACVYAQKQVQKLANQFLLSTRRKVFITPKNYIQLLNSFNTYLNVQKSKLDSSISKLANGVNKLQQTNNLIQQLKIKLTSLQPILQKKTVEQQNLLRKLQVDRQQAGQAKAVVQEQEKVIAEKTQKALEEKKEADRILNQALPALHAATQALNTLNRNDISQIKMNQNPHMQVKFTLQSVSILLQEKQDWQNVRKTISDVNFISRLKNLDVYSIPPKVEDIIKKKLKTNPNFKPNEIKQINFAAKSLCQWVLAVVNFTDVNKQIVKKKILVKKLNQQLAISNKELQSKRDQLNKIITKVKQLQKMFNQSRQQKEQLDRQIILTGKRLVNAEQLTDGLKNQKVRWAQYLIQLDQQKKSIVGNVFLATCYIVYLGPYSGNFRTQCVETLMGILTQQTIKFSQNFDLKNIVGDNLQMAEWVNYGLPKDNVSINSALIVSKTLQNPMMIDPQLQASRWIRNMLKQQQLVYLKMGTQSFLKLLQSAIRMKNPIIIQNSQNSIDPSIDALMAKQYQLVNNRYFVKLGQNKLQVDQDMKIYMFTKVSNPLFSPQIFIKLCVINFTVTPAGLQDQLLADVVQNELPQVQLKKRELVAAISKGKATLQRNEDKILQLLNNSKGNILDDVQLIENLKVSKRVSSEVKISLEQSVIKSKQIQQARSAYQPVANRGAVLYIIISQLSNIQSMYQFSLQYFSRIFNNVLRTTPVAQSTIARVQSLINQLTKTMYYNISRALFNQHKKIFSFMIAARVQAINKIQYKYFNKGNFSLGKIQQPPKPIASLKPEISTSLYNLNKVFSNNLYQLFLKGGEKILNTYNSDPLKSLKTNDKILSSQDVLSPFRSLIVTKILRPQLTVQAITEYISDILGSQFVDSYTPTMNQIYNDVSNKVPLVFILSAGADPLHNLLRLSKELQKKSQQIFIISLGQGQGVPALKAVQNASKNGGWVILQNCHLGKSFMPVLQKKVQQLNQSSEVSQNFRLFLTSMPCDYFPVSILQNSLKVTSQPPRGIKANLKQLMNNITWKKSDEQKTLTFNLCLFHAIVLERRKFGSLGWNILYDFNESDLQTSLTIVNNLLETYEQPPWDAIQYFVGQIVYGGRVTDDFDRRLLKTLLKDFISPQTLQNPKVIPGPPENYLTYIEAMPQQDHPQLFGMNSNAQTTYLFKIAKQALQNIMLLQPQQAISNDNTKTITMIEELINKVPATIKSTIQEKKNPDAVDICLEQQAARFNNLISFIQKNLKELIKAVKGQIIMTQTLQDTFNSLTVNIVPKSWAKKAYPSMKPFSSWFTDFIERVTFFRQALNERPKIYWISAFFFPQGFLTSVLQIYARKMKIPVDTLNFQFIFKQQNQKDLTESAPSDGCFIHGLYSQACVIDYKLSSLKQSPPGVIESQVPVIHFKPVQGKATYTYNISQIPIYKTKKRAGTLSTTGHSTNFIISVACKCDSEQSFWIKRGAAFICALDR